jgi:hypothetical protein
VTYGQEEGKQEARSETPCEESCEEEGWKRLGRLERTAEEGRGGLARSEAGTMTLEVPIQRVYDDLDFVTDRISAQVRTIAIGVLALAWLFLAGGKDTPSLGLQHQTKPLLGVAALAIVALLCDYLQYLAGYLATNAVRTAAERANRKTATYDYRDVRYGLRGLCFWLKQAFAAAATIWMLVMLVRALVANSTSPG